MQESASRVRSTHRRALIGIGAVLAAWALGPSTAALADEPGNTPKLEFERYTLENGLEVILHKDNRVPVVTVDVWYHVGSGNEVPGRSGFAHLFEHMLFQGSKHVGSDKHFDILRNAGASFVNGSTNTDRTNYFEIVPSHQLETALWLESDRMGYLLPLLTKESLDNQIEVVRNERRQNYDNVPYGTTRLALAEALYPEGHPYRYTTIGRHEDLAAATLDDVKNFYKTWYVPANATLVLAGDFDTAAAKQLIEKWFGSFPRSQKPRQREVAFPVIKKKRVEIVDQFAKLPMVTYAWHSPAFMQSGDAELDILAHALGAEGTGRLYQTLVHKRQLAQQVRVFQQSQENSSIFMIQVVLRSGADMSEVERAIQEEVSRVRKEPISRREFDRAVVDVESQMIWDLESPLSRAETLHRYNHYVGTPDYIRQDIERYTKSSPEAVHKFTVDALLPDRRVEILTLPATEETKK